jgi:hypothetical protein
LMVSKFSAINFMVDRISVLKLGKSSAFIAIPTRGWVLMFSSKLERKIGGNQRVVWFPRISLSVSGGYPAGK